MGNLDAHLAHIASLYAAKTAGSKAVAKSNRPQIANLQFFMGFKKEFKEVHYPLAAARSEGSRYWDVDGNEYLDFCMGFGVHLFGYSPPFVRTAIEEQLSRGIHVGPQAECAAEAARLFCALTGSERVFFSNTGTEAVMTALRLARCATRREKVVIFEGAYHGHADHFILERDAEGNAIPSAPGVAKGFAHDTYVLEFGSPASLQFIRDHGQKIAAVLVDPLPVEEGEILSKEFLHALRHITLETGSALIFDEVLTGLRLGMRGAQGWFGVDADLAAYGKVLASGLPVGAVGGKAEFLDAVDGGAWNYGDDSMPRIEPTLATGTFCRNPLTMAATAAILREIEKRGDSFYAGLNARAEKLRSDLSVATRDLPFVVDATGSIVVLDPTDNRLVPLFYWHLALRGFGARRGDCFVSDAHTDDELVAFANAVREIGTELREVGMFA